MMWPTITPLFPAGRAAFPFVLTLTLLMAACSGQLPRGMTSTTTSLTRKGRRAWRKTTP